MKCHSIRGKLLHYKVVRIFYANQSKNLMPKHYADPTDFVFVFIHDTRKALYSTIVWLIVL